MSGWKTDYIACKFPEEQVSEMKLKYGKLLAAHDRNSDTAFVDPMMDVIFHYDVSAKIYAKGNWVFDKEVQDYVEHYLSDGIGDVLPKKEKVAKMFLDIAKNSFETKDKILALREYSQIMGYSKDDGAKGNVQNVLLISDNGDQTSWEEKMLKQQHGLIEKAESLLAENDK